MFVRQDWTRRGLGTQILRACEAAARRAGFRMLGLMATLPGFELYRRYGFRELERTAITLPDGIDLECVARRKTSRCREGDPWATTAAMAGRQMMDRSRHRSISATLDESQRGCRRVCGRFL